MGQGADDANAAWEVLEARGTDPDVYYGTKKPKRRKRKDEPQFKPAATVHRPANDAEAKALIESLDHFEWDTRKVSGRFDRNPYTLVAVIDGVTHEIKLAGRFGGVMRWLDARERELAGVA